MYLGTFGQMVGIKCPTTQRVAPAERYSFNTTLGGTVKAQAGPRGRRTWDVSLGQLSTPSEVGTLLDFATGVWGSGPFWFVPTDAPVVNLMTPAAASCDPDSIEINGGAELLGSPPLDLGTNGWAARAVWKTAAGQATLGGPVPIIPSKDVTGSVWVRGQGRISLSFTDATGSQISAAYSDEAVHSAPQRLAVSATAPPTAVAVRLTVADNITHAAHPAITWTDQPYELGDGQGCEKAVVTSVNRDLVSALSDPRGGRWSGVSFTVHELG